MKQIDSTNQCPSCGSSQIHPTFSILFTLVEWPVALGFFGLVLLAGELLAFSPGTSCKFGMLASLPLLLRFLRKQSCARCGTQTQKKLASLNQK